MQAFQGILFGVLSAAIWGTSDFAGGLAARRISALQVLVLVSALGIASLGLIALVVDEPFPSPNGRLWALAAGSIGAVALAAFYRGLAIGRAALVAPTAAVIGAAVPVVFGALLEGFPSAAEFIGLLFGMVGIWLVSRSSAAEIDLARSGLREAVVAGVGFGAFYVLIAQVDPGLILTPLIISKSAALLLAVPALLIQRERVPSPLKNPLAIVAGLFDAGGNGFYMLAQEATRLDIAAVLASMFPAVTVFWSGIFLKEPILRSQWWGVGICLAAVALIAV